MQRHRSPHTDDTATLVTLDGRSPQRSDATVVDFEPESLAMARHLATRQALEAGLDESRADGFALAVGELLANSIRHGGGGGTMSVWSEPGSLFVEVADSGYLEDPFVGTRAPLLGQIGGLGLWMVNQLADLVHIHTTPEGTRVRVRFDLR